MSSPFGRKLYLLLSATCDEIVSYMIKFWMKSHLVSDNNCNIVNLYFPKKLQGMTNNIDLRFNVGDTIPWFTISIEQENKN
jgi:hypothetical protein